VKLFNLEADKLYNFTFFASRNGVNDIRDATYAVTGANSLTGDLNASNNHTDVLRLDGISPDGNNEIYLDVTPGPNNSNGIGFYYINLMQVDVVAIPEPMSASLLLSGLGLSLASRRTSRRG